MYTLQKRADAYLAISKSHHSRHIMRQLGTPYRKNWPQPCSFHPQHDVVTRNSRKWQARGMLEADELHQTQRLATCYGSAP